jgi:glycosyltransferase involved in cell wall biosynthesis
MQEINPDPCNRDPFRVLAVVVLYKIQPNESVAFKTLQDAILTLSPEGTDIQVLLYDNSPRERNPATFEKGVQYVVAQKNGGLAAAYNYALEIAREEDITWLLTLDQDTALPLDFLSRLKRYALANVSRLDVAAIVPRLEDGTRSLSPVIRRPWGISHLNRDLVGIAPYKVGAVNSGSLFRVSALRQIGGFSRYFWLDQLDADVFRKIHLHGKYVYIAGDIHLKHELSILHEESISPERFRNYLLAESAYLDLYGTLMERTMLSVRLLGRLVKQRMRKAPQDVRQLTKYALQRRVFLSRKRRIGEWRAEMGRRLQGLEPDQEELTGVSGRPPVSVCMAAYNGERYILDQLKSILIQLDDTDEIVVVDDGSTDATCELISALGDPRIRLIRHVRNLGMLQTFEDALRSASNGILFLSDQDDLWVRDKIDTVRQAFIDHPQITLVVTDSSLMNADGTVFLASYLGKYGRFRPGFFSNLFRNRYGAHNTAFRACILSKLLPFPRKRGILHDHWIGLRHSLEYGDAYFIDRPLTLSRRHDRTVTGRKHRSILEKMLIRGALIQALWNFRIQEWAKRI